MDFLYNINSKLAPKLASKRHQSTSLNKFCILYSRMCCVQHVLFRCAVRSSHGLTNPVLKRLKITSYCSVVPHLLGRITISNQCHKVFAQIAELFLIGIP